MKSTLAEKKKWKAPAGKTGAHTPTYHTFFAGILNSRHARKIPFVAKHFLYIHICGEKIRIKRCGVGRNLRPFVLVDRNTYLPIASRRYSAQLLPLLLLLFSVFKYILWYFARIYAPAGLRGCRAKTLKDSNTKIGCVRDVILVTELFRSRYCDACVLLFKWNCFERHERISSVSYPCFAYDSITQICIKHIQRFLIIQCF